MSPAGMWSALPPTNPLCPMSPGAWNRETESPWLKSGKRKSSPAWAQICRATASLFVKWDQLIVAQATFKGQRPGCWASYRGLSVQRPWPVNLYSESAAWLFLTLCWDWSRKFTFRFAQAVQLHWAPGPIMTSWASSVFHQWLPYQSLPLRPGSLLCPWAWLPFFGGTDAVWYTYLLSHLWLVFSTRM